MRARLIVQLDNITPTGPRNGKFFIPGIRGLAVWCSFMKRRRGAAQARCAALIRVRRAHAVWKRPNGCSIGQPAVGWCVVRGDSPRVSRAALYRLKALI